MGRIIVFVLVLAVLKHSSAYQDGDRIKRHAQFFNSGRQGSLNAALGSIQQNVQSTLSNIRESVLGQIGKPITLGFNAQVTSNLNQNLLNIGGLIPNFGNFGKPHHNPNQNGGSINITPSSERPDTINEPHEENKEDVPIYIDNTRVILLNENEIRR